MVAYMIVDLDIRDPTGFQEYRSRVPQLIAKHGGKYIVRGGEFEVVEGDWKPHRLVLFQFPDRQAIRNLFADPDYGELRALRQRTTKSAIVAVDGM